MPGRPRDGRSRPVGGGMPEGRERIQSGNRAQETGDRMDKLEEIFQRQRELNRFTFEKNRIRLFSSNPEIGEARDKINVDYKGPGIEIGFNGQYFIDFLAVVETEKVRFELKDENSAALVRPEGEENPKSLYVLMPMKI